MDVWVIYDAPKDCMCWRDVICTHGWTWQEGDTDDDTCNHWESFESVHVSFADAVRDLYVRDGKSAIGRLLRQRYSGSFKTRKVFVMRSDAGPLVDDHDAGSFGPRPMVVIARERLLGRSTPRNDPDRIRNSAANFASV